MLVALPLLSPVAPHTALRVYGVWVVLEMPRTRPLDGGISSLSLSAVFLLQGSVLMTQAIQ